MTMIMSTDDMIDALDWWAFYGEELAYDDKLELPDVTQWKTEVFNEEANALQRLVTMGAEFLEHDRIAHAANARSAAKDVLLPKTEHTADVRWALCLFATVCGLTDECVADVATPKVNEITEWSYGASLLKWQFTPSGFIVPTGFFNDGRIGILNATISYMAEHLKGCEFKQGFIAHLVDIGVLSKKVPATFP